MGLLQQLLLVTACLVLQEAKALEAKIQLTHGQSPGNVVKGKRTGDQEVADLADVQKFFPKVATDDDRGDFEKFFPQDKTNDDGKDNDKLDGFTDSIADSLDDAQAELLVAGQAPSKVCARDIKRFCGEGAMKQKHPLHCLGLLKDQERAQIHKLCRVHIQESLTFSCATDMDKIGCDAVMTSTIDCLTEGIETISEECRDQVRLVAKVVAKVNNAHITVTSQEDGKTVTKIHDGEYNNGNWQCPADFKSHHTHAPCCFYLGDCSEKDARGETKFQCAKRRCNAVQGKWVLKDPEGMEMGGHLCCPSKKNGVDLYIDHKNVQDDDDPYLASEVKDDNSIPIGKLILYVVVAALIAWKHRFIFMVLKVIKQVAYNEIDGVQLPTHAVELSTFISGIFSAVKKEVDFVKAPEPNKQSKEMHGCGTGGSYGGL